MHRDGTGNAFFQFAPKLWCVNRFARLLLADSAQKVNIAQCVKGVLRAFAPGAAQALQLRICEVKTVHGYDLHLWPQRLQKLPSEG